MLRCIAAALVLSSTASCVGFNKGAIPSSSAARSSADPGSVSKKIKATLRITIPRRRHEARRLLRGRYVSPATASIGIKMTPASGPSRFYNQNLTPATNPNCVASLISPTVCTVTLALPAGTYVATFSTYDGVLNANGSPTGNRLSANQNLPIVIAPGSNNAINVTLDGIPASVVLLPLTGLSGETDSGFIVSKCLSSAKVEVLGLDADGNVIVGTGAPAPALSSNDTTHLSVSATPVPSSPNTFTLSRPTLPNARSVVKLTASVTPAAPSGAPPRSATVSVTFNSDICGVITEFSTGMTSGGNPYGIVVGRDGNLWFTEYNGSRIGRITTAGAITEFSTGVTSGSGPSGIAAGSDGNLWFAETNADQIGRITTTGAVNEFSVGITANSAPTGIVGGPDGNLWFTENTGDQIGRITTVGVVNEFSAGLSGSSKPLGITVGPDGAMWFTEYSGGRIGTITIAGVITQFSTGITSGAEPSFIAAGPDGNLWFTEHAGDRIAEATTAGSITELPDGLVAGSKAAGITAGADGNLWFAECVGNRIGRVTTSGEVTEFLGLTPGSGPWATTLGPDGNIWFTEFNGNRIGRLQ
jgi:streptogramin lyase